MQSSSTAEVRLEIYADGELSPELVSGISAALSQRWPVEWDVKIPPKPSPTHPAEWRSVVPIPDGQSFELMHQGVADSVRQLDASHLLHFRTRWAHQETPDHQEVYEERWTPDRR
jgi:hypothetical protein